ncbi:Uncharacterized protein Fot_06313 [Forsythia ovata]|uniref:Uncharacterized protein n=1 Tax=Forsythia ovata TaxID=205694 RepID=A0ABD1WSR5_9LAMI
MGFDQQQPAPQSTTNVAANTVYKSHQPAVQHTGFGVEPNYPSQDGGEIRGRRSGRRQKQGLRSAGEEQQGRAVPPARSNRGERGSAGEEVNGQRSGARRPSEQNGSRNEKNGSLAEQLPAERNGWRSLWVANGSRRTTMGR